MAHSSAEYMKAYMRKYIACAEDVPCECCNTTYKSYRKCKHVRSKKHIKNMALAHNQLSTLKINDPELHLIVEHHLLKNKLKECIDKFGSHQMMKILNKELSKN